VNHRPRFLRSERWLSWVSELPLIGQPSGEIGGGSGRQVYQQLREVKLRIQVMAAARTC
jgi:hypothetical protein